MFAQKQFRWKVQSLVYSEVGHWTDSRFQQPARSPAGSFWTSGLAKMPIHVSLWRPAWPWKKNQNSQNVDGTQNSLSLTTENSVKQYVLHVTDQTVNFWVYPPSNPGTQETLAWFISVVTDTEDTAWGLVPKEKKKKSLSLLRSS